MAAGVTIDTSPLRHHAGRLSRLADTARERVVTRTIGTLRRKVLTEARRAMAQQFGVGVQAIGQRITAETDADSLTVYGTSGRLSLHLFGGRYGGRKTPGATAEIKRGGRRVYASAFTIDSRGKTIYGRPLVASGRRAPRQFVRLHGPSVGSMFLGRGGAGGTPADAVSEIAQDIFRAEIDRLLTVEESR